MSWFLRCSWCGGPFNGGNCRHCTNVGFEDEPVYDSNPNSYNQTLDFSNPPPHHNYEIELRSNKGAAFQAEFAKFQQNFERFMSQLRCSNCGGLFNGGNYPEDSLIMGNEDLSTIFKKKSDEFIKSSVEDLDPIPSESEDTPGSDSECDLSTCENNLMSGNPTPFNYKVKSLSPSPTPYEDSDPLLKETDILISHFDNSLPEYETFSFDIEEKSSGSTTTHSDYSLLDYEAFYFDDDHIKEKSSGSTTTHFDFSLPEYDSFIFDLSIDSFPPVDRSVSHHEEFAYELTHIVFSPEYDCFYFNTETDTGELTILFEENISKDSTTEFISPELNDFPLLLSDCNSTFSKEFYEIDLLVSFPSGNKDKVFDPGISEKTFSPTYVSLPFKDRQYVFFTYVVRIHLLYFTYLMVSHFLLSSRSEDTIFDPCNSAFYFSHWSETFMCFNVYSDILIESPMEICSSTSFYLNIMML
nr:hypothetical protein [Tanacetum cinerariifolium]